MRYRSNCEHASDPLDMGIDLPGGQGNVVLARPGRVTVVDTGTVMAFPVFGRLRRFLTRLLLGVEVTGIGGIIKPRSRSDLIVMAGVVDPGYRGSIKVKVFNPLGTVVAVDSRFAQIVPVLCLNVDLERVDSISADETQRGDRGGINL